ncbi:MAG: YihA family ribosome biogenesis GTP-binding protein [Verrucomicrobia bacterium]|nr:YihA family ribosome biogenesis GTP-binding protein [Verrucomicrobiota bacterium]
MKIDTAEFRFGCPHYDGLPAASLPEFAFVGRSNVGKSSLINMLTGRKELAHTSRKPGKTRCINCFDINHRWHLVDLPGYGYAKVSKMKQIDFNRDVSTYLTERSTLEQGFLLADSQLEPLDQDLYFAQWLQECDLPYSLILTKTDRTTNATVYNHKVKFEAALAEWKLKPTEIFHCSAKSGKGRNEILQWIDGRLPRKSKKKGKGSTINLNWMK